ncbi:VOC family protein [Pararobbsia silviterrae]|uniref:VOC family protein n=1 Tax=Pararobbsia silviterrae TaxID=1792498 RepID=A0A494XA85_9BURK|nr:VOC family protein [Pararobbsia silviterrae]RKP47717.1 VOC family protein [Pararobbsia silviterrae]
MQTMSTFLWFNGQAEEAATFYTRIFRDARVKSVMRYGDAGPGPKGAVMTVEFEAFGQRFVALNGGPAFSFTPAVSFMIHCDSQTEIDALWDALLEGGGVPVQCGWLRDRFGVSWQVVPHALFDMLNDADAAKTTRVTRAMLRMVKLDLPALERAYRGD